MWDWSELKADGKDEKSEGGDDQSETSDENDSQSEMTEVEEENIHKEDQVWKAIQVLKHIESLDGNYQGFVQHTNPCDIHIISQCCYNLLENNIPLPLSKKKNIKIILNKLGQRNIKRLLDYRETVGVKREILEKHKLDLELSLY